MKLAFCHNVYDRVRTLNNTISIEKELFPDSIISVAYNNKIIKNDIINNKNINKYVYFEQQPHKIGCVNGFILSIQQILNEDVDVIIFSHDDVYINRDYIDVFNNNINDIYLGNYDIICRSPDGFGNYIMMETLFLRKHATISLIKILEIFLDENNIDKDHRQSISPEVWLFKILTNNPEYNIKFLKYVQEDHNYNDILGSLLGTYHKNIGLRGWQE